LRGFHLTFLAALIAAASAGAQTSTAWLLIASPQSQDPDFRESVILLLHNSSDGAVGLMLNLPTRAGIRELFPELQSSKAAIYAGGPLRIGVNALLRSNVKPGGASNLFANVWLISDRSAIRKLAVNPPAAFRIYLGQCGWSAAQLQDEIRRGLWITAPSQPAAVFDPNPDTLWTRLTAKRPAQK